MTVECVNVEMMAFNNVPKSPVTTFTAVLSKLHMQPQLAQWHNQDFVTRGGRGYNHDRDVMQNV